MKQVVIENPVINSPFEEPKRHFLFSEDGITNEIVEPRRISSYFVPIPKPKKKGKQKQLSFESEWTQDRLKENNFNFKTEGRPLGLLLEAHRLEDVFQPFALAYERPT